jgi:hypothetical protein
MIGGSIVDVPADVPFDPDNPPESLPDLPPGYVWALNITAEAEVVKAADAQQEG